MTRPRTPVLALALLSTAFTLHAVAAPSALQPPAPAAPARQASAISAIAAQQLARLALIDFRNLSDAGPAESRYNARLLRDAANLDPTNAPIIRLAIDASANSGNQQGTIDLCKMLVTLNPQDTSAQLDLIRARVAICQTAEERLAILDSLLGPRGDSIDPSVRARLAVDSALIKRERGDGAGFVKDLTTATTLDSSYYTAAALALEYYSSRVKEPEGKFELLTSTLISSPLDASIHAAIAHELAVAGATEQAVRFYENARLLYARQGDVLPIDGQEEYLVQLWKLRGPQVVVKPLNDAIDSERRQAQIDIDVANATNKPSDQLPRPESRRHPIAMERIRLAAAIAAADRSTIDRSLLDLQASLAILPEKDPSRLAAEAEAAYLRALANAGDIAADAARLRTRGAPADALARLDAWMKHRRGSTAAARAAFEAMKDDRLAQLALAVIDLEAKPAPGTTQARALDDRLVALVNESPASPISAWATTVYKDRNEGKFPPLSTKAGKFAAMGAGIPLWLDDIAKEPGRVISIKVEPAKSRALTPIEPALLNIRISNNSPVSVAIGNGLTVDDKVLISTSVDIGGVNAPDASKTEVVSIGGRLRILPREEVVFTVWPDPGFGGWAVQNLITKAARLRFSVIHGFEIRDVPRTSPFGTRIEAGPIARGSLPLYDVSRLCSEIGSLQEEEFAAALLHARLQLLNFEKPLTIEQAKKIVGAISDRYRRATAAERIVILTLTPTPLLAAAVIDLELVVSQIDETDPAVARAALLTRVDTLNSPLLNKFRLFPDTGVQEAVRVIEARIADGKSLLAKAAPLAAPKRPKPAETPAGTDPAQPATPTSDAPLESPFGKPTGQPAAPTPTNPTPPATAPTPATPK